MDQGRIIALGAALALGACATAMDDGTAEPPAPPPADACGAAMFEGMIGEPRGEIHEPSLPQPYRIIEPGDAVTKDYRPDRLNIYLDDDGHVSRVYCG